MDLSSTSIYCQSCGYPNPLAAIYCGQCGKRIEEESGEVAIELTQPKLAIGRGFLGHKDLIQQFPKYAQKALNRNGQFIEISGPSGIGKTAFLWQAVPFLKKNGFRVELLDGLPETKHLTLFPIHMLIARLLGLKAETGEEEIASRLAELKHFGITDIDIFYLSHLFPVDLPRRNARHLPDEYRLRGLRAAAIHLVQKLARQQPLALLFDHTDWVDRYSRIFINWLARILDRERILVVVANREASDPIDRPDNVYQHTLGGLRLRDCITIARAYTSTERLPAELEEHLEEFTEGVPFRIIQLLDFLKERQYLVEKKGYWKVNEKYRGMEMPDSLQTTWNNRYNLMKPHLHELLALVSVLSSQCSVENLSQLYPHSGYLEQDLEEMVSKRILRIARQGKTRQVAFTHNSLQEFVYQKISGSGRQSYHNKSAALLGKHPSRKNYLEKWLIDYHSTFVSPIAFGETTRLEDTADAFLKRLHFDAAANCLQTVSQIWRKKVEKEPELSVIYSYKMFDSLKHLARCYRAMGDIERTEKTYRILLGLTHKINAKHSALDILTELATLYSMRGHPDKAKECYKQGETITNEMKDNAAWKRIQSLQGEWYLAQGELEKARQLFEEAALKETDGEFEIHPRASWTPATSCSIGKLFLENKKFDAALKYLVEAFDGSLAAGDIPLLIKTLENLSLLCAERYDLERAIGFAELGQHLGRHLGDQLALANFTYHAGRFYDLKENRRDATIAYRDSLEIAKELLWTPGIKRCQTALMELKESEQSNG